MLIRGGFPSLVLMNEYVKILHLWYIISQLQKPTKFVGYPNKQNQLDITHLDLSI